jgi:hypothetical protein
VEQVRTAFALAGLGGNNAHGAGFLAAAQDVARQRDSGATDGNAAGTDGAVRSERVRRGILPELEFISCTSGAIASAASYLRGDDLLIELEARIAAVDRMLGLPKAAWTQPWRAPLLALYTGIPGVFGPWVEAFAQHLWAQTAAGGGSSAAPSLVDRAADFWLPARTFVPRLPQVFFDRTAETFTDARHGVGVAFNSFDPGAGVEHLYVNDAALQLIREHHDRDADYDRARGRTVYQPITPAAVRAALWLFYYGFPAEQPTGNHIDGAYCRSIIVDELTFADRVYAVKPVNDRWLGRLPQNLLEVQDMQTELWMNASWREQGRLIETVNRLHSTDRLGPGAAGKRYHHIDLVPVEIEQQRGFFTYFVEDRAVFDTARAQAMAALQAAELIHA